MSEGSLTKDQGGMKIADLEDALRKAEERGEIKPMPEGYTWADLQRDKGFTNEQMRQIVTTVDELAGIDNE